MLPTVGSPAMADRQVTPILAEMYALGTRSSFEELFNWMVEPQRTADEFTYAMGPLNLKVHNIMRNHFSIYMRNRFFCPNLSQVAAEALAVKSSILEDPRERTTWLFLLTKLSGSYYASDRFCTWIINVIGDPEFCPDSFLRIELLIVFYHITNKEIFKHPKILESVLSACSSFNHKYIQDKNLLCIASVLSDIVDAKYDVKFDEALAANLHDTKASLLSAVVRDFACRSTVNPNRYSHPVAFYGITALLKNIGERARKELRRYRERRPERQNDWHTLLTTNLDLTWALRSLICNVKKSCRTPQLVNLTASSIVDILELVFVVNVEALCEFYDSNLEYLAHEAIAGVDKLLKNLLDEISHSCLMTSPEILECFHQPLAHIEQVVSQHPGIFSSYSMIKILADCIKLYA